MDQHCSLASESAANARPPIGRSGSFCGLRLRHGDRTDGRGFHYVDLPLNMPGCAGLDAIAETIFALTILACRPTRIAPICAPSARQPLPICVAVARLGARHRGYKAAATRGMRPEDKQVKTGRSRLNLLHAFAYQQHYAPRCISMPRK